MRKLIAKFYWLIPGLIVVIAVGLLLLFNYIKSNKSVIEWDQNKTQTVIAKTNIWQGRTTPILYSTVVENMRKELSKELIELAFRKKSIPRFVSNLKVRTGSLTEKDLPPDKIIDNQIFRKWIYSAPDEDNMRLPIAWAEFSTKNKLFSVGTLDTPIVINFVGTELPTGETNYLAEVWRYRAEDGPQEVPERVRLPISEFHTEHVVQKKNNELKIRWLNPRLGVGPSLHYSTDALGLYPAIDLNLMISGYGKTEYDQTVKFLGMNVSSGVDNGSLHFVPVQLRTSKHTPNTYLFISGGVGFSYRKPIVSPEISGGLNIGL